MNQLRKRLSTIEEIERTRLIAESDAIISGMSDEELLASLASDSSSGCDFSTMNEEELRELIEQDQVTVSIHQRRQELGELKQWLAQRRA